MQNFNYIARNRAGRIVRGELHSVSAVDLRSQLSAMELQLISFTAQTGRFSLNLLAGLYPNAWMPIRSGDVELFLHQLAIMLRSGQKLLDALKALQMQASKRSLSSMLDSLYGSVSRGQTLSQAMAQHRSIPAIVVQLVCVGEQTGFLAEVLTQAHDHLRRRRTMVVEVRFALCYPVIVVLAALSIAAYLVLYVIPQLELFLSTLGRKLPAITQSLVDLSHWLKIHGGASVVSIAVLLAASLVMLYSPQGRLVVDRYALRLPLIGGILRLAGTAGLTSSLSIMLRSGIRLVDAIVLSSQVQGNKHQANLLKRSAKAVAAGRPLAPTLTDRHGFSPILSSMIEVAEQSGQLNQTLDEVANYCDSELSSRVKRLTQLIEPAVIVVAGAIVGYVYVAFFIALMSAGGSLK